MTQREKLELIFTQESDRAYLIEFVLWCFDRNMKVTPVSHCLWERELRGKASKNNVGT